MAQDFPIQYNSWGDLFSALLAGGKKAADTGPLTALLGGTGAPGKTPPSLFSGLVSGDIARNPDNYRVMPPDPSFSPAQNIARGLISDTINLPWQAGSALAGLAGNFFFKPENANQPASPQAALPQQAAPVQEGSALPSVLQEPNQASTNFTMQGTPVPQPPQIPAPPDAPMPPQMPMPAAPNFDAVRSHLAASAPRQTDPQMLQDLKTQLVLSGLFGGANIKDVSSPGSTGQLWASLGAGAGAGGAKAAQLGYADKKDYDRRVSAHEGKLADAEMQFERARLNYENTRAETQYRNMKAEYDTTLANAREKYQVDVKNTSNRWAYDKAIWEASQPKLNISNGTVMVQEPDPKTGKTVIKVIPTRDNSKYLDDMRKASELGWGKDETSTAPRQAVKYQTLLKMSGGDPNIVRTQMLRETITDVINGGGGATVFGKAFEAARKDAMSDPSVQALAAKPKELNAKLSQLVIEKLFGSVLSSNNLSWLKSAQVYSLGAKILYNKPAK